MASAPIPHGDDDLRVCAHPRVLRAAAAGLLLLSGASLVVVLGWALLATAPPATLPGVLRAFLAFSALPAIAAWGVGRALATRLEIARDALRLSVGGQRLTAPLGSITGVVPWRLPLPQAGFSLDLATGDRFPLGISADDPASILTRLADAGVPGAAAAARHPSLLYAHVKHTAGRLGPRRLVAKFALFGALVAGVLFNEQQRIGYGGPLGQYELEGLLPFARAFVATWAATTLYLVLYASAWRVPAEAAAWLAAWRGERTASFARRVAELVCRIAYFAGVPFLLALRFAE